MSIYVPNLGEKKFLQGFLVNYALRLGLYKNIIAGSGGLVYASVEGVSEESGGYAPKDLVNAVTESALTANKWYVATNASDKAEGQYSNAAQNWTFIDLDVANGETAYGVYAWTLILNFTAGSGAEIKVGDKISDDTDDDDPRAFVTDVVVTSGTWGVDAAGWLAVKTQTGTFPGSGQLWVVGGGAQSATISTDTTKILIFIEPFTTEQPIDTVGQVIEYTPKITLSTA